MTANPVQFPRAAARYSKAMHQTPQHAALAASSRPILFAALLAFIPLQSRADSRSQAPSLGETEAALAAIADLAEARYVFPEKGARIAAELRESAASGAFSDFSDWEDFATRATRLLQEISGDGHMYVRRDPEIVAELRAGPSEAEEDSASQARARAGNFGFKEARILEGGLGYLKLSEIDINEESLPILWASMRFLESAPALAIDLRDNGGGGSTVGPILESLFLPPGTPLLEFRRRGGKPELQQTLASLPVARYEKPLILIVNGGTASAAEYFAYVMQLRGRATLVGQRTAGAAHMNSWYPVNEHVFLSVSTGAPTIPGTEISWERVGVAPERAAPAGEELEFVIENWARIVASDLAP